MAKALVKPGYRPRSEDTTAEVDIFGFSLLRQRTHKQRLDMGATLNRNARQFSINCFRKRFSSLTAAELAQKFDYLTPWASRLDILDLLNQAKIEARV